MLSSANGNYRYLALYIAVLFACVLAIYYLIVSKQYFLTEGRSKSTMRKLIPTLVLCGFDVALAIAAVKLQPPALDVKPATLVNGVVNPVTRK